ncbi:MAG: capsule assembly Wzi family protein [Gemmatimonadota bacterium]|nr:capsule assembly Wzi family protein [Gemmatimonadota bacterium]
MSARRATLGAVALAVITGHVGVLHAQGRARPTPQATAYLPVTDAAYADLDALITSGFVTEPMVGERPYSRAAIRRFVAEAERRFATVSPPARAREALTRLRARVGAPVSDERGTSGAAPFLGRTPVAATLAATTSENRAMISGTRDDRIDAVVNPMLQRAQGRVLLDAATAAAEAGAFVERGHLAAEVSGRAYGGTPHTGGATGAVDLLTGYARAVAGPWALDVGRVPRVTGFGIHGGAMLSDNARALDLVQLRQERPVRLPGPFRHLGSWQASAYLADLGHDRDQPGSALLHMRLSARPTRHVEVGVSYLNQHGGRNAPPSLQWQRLLDIFLFAASGDDYEITDKVAAVDLRVALPALRTALYANFLTTDDRGRFSQPAGGYWEDAIWLVGAERVGLGPDARVDLRLEARHTGPRPHTHAQYSSGMTVDGLVLGDALGPSSSGITVQGDFTGAAARWRVELSSERYVGDLFHAADQPGGDEWNWDWFRLADNPDEARQRVLVNYLRFRGWRGYETSLRGGVERVTGFGYTTRGPRWGLLAQMTVRALP